MMSLPDNYDPSPLAVQSLTESVPGFQLYGGADISRTSDANGVLYMACCARGPDGDFRFRVFRYMGNVATDLPLQARCTGRGEISIDQYSGKPVWIAWEGSQFFTAPIPGAAAFPTESAAQLGAYIPLNPNRYYAGLDGQLVSGGRWLDIPSLYGLPVTCRAYDVRLAVNAAVAGHRGRLGLETQPGQFSVPVQVANLQNAQNSIVNAGPGGSLWLSIADVTGATGSTIQAQIWLTIVGYWP